MFYSAAIYTRFSNPSAFTVAAFPFFTLLLVMGLRGIEVGTDTLGYINEFQNADTRYRVTEFGFSYFNKFINTIGSSPKLYLMAVSLVTLSPIAWVIHKYSKNITLSYLLYANLGYMAFAMSGIRQTIAISITSLALIFLLKNRKLAFCALVILAATFHNTALIFFLLLPIVRISLTQLQAIGMFIILLITPLLLMDAFLSLDYLLLQTYLNEYLDDSSSSNILVIIIAILPPLVALFLWPKGNDTNKNTTFFILTALAMSIVVAGNDFQMLSRLALYFNIYSIILLPNLIERIRPTSIRWLARASMLILSICFFSLSIPGNSIGIDSYTF